MSLKSRVARLHADTPAGTRARDNRKWWAGAMEKNHAIEHFLDATAGFPFEFGGEFPEFGEVIQDGYQMPRTAPLWARLLFGFFDQGWFPCPLPGAWAEWVEANPNAPFDGEDCEDCGLLHPAGVQRCLHCNGLVKRRGYRAKNGRPNLFGHDTEPLGLNGGKSIGWYLLHRGDPNVFDPLRRVAGREDDERQQAGPDDEGDDDEDEW